VTVDAEGGLCFPFIDTSSLSAAYDNQSGDLNVIRHYLASLCGSIGRLYDKH